MDKQKELTSILEKLSTKKDNTETYRKYYSIIDGDRPILGGKYQYRTKESAEKALARIKHLIPAAKILKCGDW